MQNHFGIKDFLLFVLVGAVGIGVLFLMFQQDRGFKDTQQLRQKVLDVERSLARVERKVDAIEHSAGPGISEEMLQRLAESMGGNGASSPGSQTPDWARPGYDIDFQPPIDFVNDPRTDENYTVGGEFTEFFEAQMPKVMPFIAQDVYSRRITDILFEKLATYHPQTLELTGVLAEAWQYDPDGMWLRVKLNERARFSDGHPVTAEDVVYTWMDIIKNPQLETERVRSIVTSIENVIEIDEYTVEFEFNEALYSNLSAALNYEVLPKHFYEQFTTTQINEATGLLMGSGPYKLETINPDDQWSPGKGDFVMVRNESYWGPIRPALDSLRYRVISDRQALFVAYRNGEGDLARATSDQFVSAREDEEFMKENDALNWINMRSGYSFIAWQCGERNGERLTPFHDKRVRLAMTHLIDRQRVIDQILAGIGEIATGTYNADSAFYSPNVEPWPYDLDRARELLAEAGWIDRDGDNVLENEAGEEFEFEFTYSKGSEETRRMINYIGNQCSLVGIRMTERTIDWSILTEILNTRNFDAITFAWAASSPESDPRQIWHSESILNQGDNFIQYNNPELDEAIDNVRSTLDVAERTEHWHNFHEILHEEQPYTFLVNRPWLRFINRDFANVHTYQNGLEQVEFFMLPSAGL